MSKRKVERYEPTFEFESVGELPLEVMDMLVAMIAERKRTGRWKPDYQHSGGKDTQDCKQATDTLS